MTDEQRKELQAELREFTLRAADLQRERVELLRQIQKVENEIKLNNWKVSQHRYILNPRGDEK